jgi:hypothetical protein
LNQKSDAMKFRGHFDYLECDFNDCYIRAVSTQQRIIEVAKFLNRGIGETGNDNSIKNLLIFNLDRVQTSHSDILLQDSQNKTS